MTEDNITEIIKTLKPMRPSRIEHVKEFIGKKFGHLTILDIPGSSIKRKCIMVKCFCDCGNFRVVALSDVKRLHTTSCGCSASIRRNVHGEASSKNRKATSNYVSWSRMRVKVRKAMRDNEGRLAVGYYICESWMERDKGYPSFLEDMGRKPPKSQLRKRDNAKRFDKDNCYWRVNA